MKTIIEFKVDKDSFVYKNKISKPSHDLIIKVPDGYQVFILNNDNDELILDTNGQNFTNFKKNVISNLFPKKDNNIYVIYFYKNKFVDIKNFNRFSIKLLSRYVTINYHIRFSFSITHFGTFKDFYIESGYRNNFNIDYFGFNIKKDCEFCLKKVLERISNNLSFDFRDQDWIKDELTFEVDKYFKERGLQVEIIYLDVRC